MNRNDPPARRHLVGSFILEVIVPCVAAIILIAFAFHLVRP